MKPIEYLVIRFFDLMLIQPKETFYSTSLSLATTINNLDMKNKMKKGEDITNNKKNSKDLSNITRNTHSNLKLPLAKAEAIVASKERPDWNSEYEGRDNEDARISKTDGRSVKILDMYMMLKEAYTPIVNVVVDVIKDYTLEYRFSPDSGLTPSWLGEGEKQSG